MEINQDRLLSLSSYLHFSPPRVYGDYTPGDTHLMSSLVPETLFHLSEAHTQYFRKWTTLLLIEASAEAKWKTISDLWCLPTKSRQENIKSATHG